MIVNCGPPRYDDPRYGDKQTCSEKWILFINRLRLMCKGQKNVNPNKTHN